MVDVALVLFSGSIIGIGATITFDLWARLLHVALKIPPSNMCLVGRWLRSMPEGTIRHANISSSPRMAGECTIGWIAHYLIGISFAIAFIAMMGVRWLQDPSLAPAILFGLVTAIAPLFIMQPLFGLGFASSRAPHPAQARLRTLMNHAAFGFGLYLFATLVSWVSRPPS